MNSTPTNKKDHSDGKEKIAGVSEGARPDERDDSALTLDRDRSFADLLDRLGAADDQYRFEIQNGEHAGAEIALNGPGGEIVIGFDNRGELAWTGGTRIASPCAVVRN